LPQPTKAKILGQENREIKNIVRDFESKLLKFLGYGEAQESASLFIRSILKKEINSNSFLQKAIHLVKLTQ